MRTPLYGIAASIIVVTIGVSGIALASNTTSSTSNTARATASAPGAPGGTSTVTGKPAGAHLLQCGGKPQTTGDVDHNPDGPRDPRTVEQIVRDVAAIDAPGFRADRLETVYQVHAGGREVARDVLHRDSAGRVNFYAALRELDGLGLVIERTGSCAR